MRVGGAINVKNRSMDSTYYQMKRRKYRWGKFLSHRLDVVWWWLLEIVVRFRFFWCCEHRQRHWYLCRRRSEQRRHRSWQRLGWHRKNDFRSFALKEYVAHCEAWQPLHRWLWHLRQDWLLLIVRWGAKTRNYDLKIYLKNTFLTSESINSVIQRKNLVT